MADLDKLAEKVKKGEIIATSHDIFGELIHEQKCPEDGIVIGKSTNPICHTGSRILHLGIIKDN